MKKLILINGLKRSGKDYTAELIEEIIGDIGIVSFAEPMKKIISETFNISLEQLEDYKNDELGIYTEFDTETGSDFLEISNFRKILQRFGTEAMKKQFGNNVWAELGIRKATEKNNDIVVLPDFRFVSEYEEAASQASFFGFSVSTIHIFNKDLPPADLHASERDLSDNNFIFDYTIDNTGKPDIKSKLVNILKSI